MEENIDCPVCRKKVDFILFIRPLNNFISTVYSKIVGTIKEQRKIQEYESKIYENANNMSSVVLHYHYILI